MENNNNSANTTANFKNNFNENKPAWIVGGLVIILAIIVIVLPRFKHEDKAAEIAKTGGCQPGFTFNATTGEKCPEEIASATPEGCTEGDKYSALTGLPCVHEAVTNNSSSTAATSSSTGKLSLAQAIALYKGKSLEVGAACAVNPASLDVSSGTRIMVHNESTKTHNVLVGNVALTILPYHYRTVPMGTAGSMAVKCDGKNAATVKVE
jgi:plastocyanin